ncbi:hypothetical protein DIPPA_06606 [Diplonema papillatum]|nr:hypothetical protein DIPPA_06606 [Diplonema papillatum]
MRVSRIVAFQCRRINTGAWPSYAGPPLVQQRRPCSSGDAGQWRPAQPARRHAAAAVAASSSSNAAGPASRWRPNEPKKSGSRGATASWRDSRAARKEAGSRSGPGEQRSPGAAASGLPGAPSAAGRAAAPPAGGGPGDVGPGYADASMHIRSSNPTALDGAGRGDHEVDPARDGSPAPKSSAVLDAVVKAGGRIEQAYSWARGSSLGRIVHPLPGTDNMWGSLNVTDTVVNSVHEQLHNPESMPRHLPRLDDAPSLAGQNARREQQSLTAAAMQQKHHNTSERGLVVSGPAPEDTASGTGAAAANEPSGWTLLWDLLNSKQYLTTQQQATKELYQRQPRFHEPTFLQDVETCMLPAFLDAFWSKDVARLKNMCTPACFHIDVAPYLKHYALLSSRCRFLMAYESVLFNRIMLVDDSEFAVCPSRSARLSRKSPYAPASAFFQGGQHGSGGGSHGESDDDLEPEPVLFAAVTAQIINCWVARTPTEPSSSPRQKYVEHVVTGDPYASEDIVYVLGLIPEKNGQWVLTSFRHCRTDAIS